MGKAQITQACLYNVEESKVGEDNRRRWKFLGPMDVNLEVSDDHHVHSDVKFVIVDEER